MRSKVWPFAAALMSCLAACESGDPLGSNLVMQLPPVQKNEPDAGVDASPGGGPVNADGPVMMAVEAGSAPETGVAPEAGSAVEAGVVVEAGSAPEVGGAPDASAPSSDAREAGALLTCAALAAGGTPARLKDFQWQYEVGVQGAFNLPYDFVTIDSACLMTYQRTVMPRPKPPAPTTITKMVPLGAVDCAAARGWVTNTRFLEVLRTGDGCPYGDGNPGDAFDLTLTDEGRVARKTYLCPEPTVESVRACLQPLVARLFPQ